jgi:hypothetical protein
MEAEGVVEQNSETKCWRIRDNAGCEAEK